MVDKNEIPTFKGLVTLGVFTPEEVYRYLDISCDNVLIAGKNVYTRSSRYSLFRRQPACVQCGLLGSVYLLQQDKACATIDRAHFNFYGQSADQQWYMLTKDHIVPRSLGGRNHHSNYQTMCRSCNNKKGNKLDDKHQNQDQDQALLARRFCLFCHKYKEHRLQNSRVLCLECKHSRYLT